MVSWGASDRGWDIDRIACPRRRGRVARATGAVTVGAGFVLIARGAGVG